MTLPPPSSAIWTDLVRGTSSIQLEFLAAKILLSRLQIEIKRDPGSGMLRRCTDELYQLYNKNTDLPAVRRDLEKFGIK